MLMFDLHRFNGASRKTSNQFFGQVTHVPTHTQESGYIDQGPIWTCVYSLYLGEISRNGGSEQQIYTVHFHRKPLC